MLRAFLFRKWPVYVCFTKKLVLIWSERIILVTLTAVMNHDQHVLLNYR
jgi:hypothetical protein